MIDLAAQQLGMNPAAIRRLNFIAADQFPYQTPVALVYDSGNYAPALDLALRKVDYPKALEEQAAARREGRYIGIGLSTYIEACSIAPSQPKDSSVPPGLRMPYILRATHQAEFA